MTLRYMGGYWVSLEFNSIKAKDNFKKHRDALSWFLVLLPWTKNFIVEDRIIWLDIEGVPLIAWTNNSVTKITQRGGGDLCMQRILIICFGNGCALKLR